MTNNSIALAEKYLPIIDEVYKKGSLTSILDTANSSVRFLGGNKIELFKISVPGFADYGRNTGFVNGDVTSTWEALTLTKDRAISLGVDAMDEEESLNQCFGATVGEFMRTKEVPEVDAYRFAQYASAVTPVKANITVGTTDVPALIDTAEMTLGDAEVPDEGRILFVSETAYSGLKAKITRVLANENGVNRLVETYDGMPVIRVPQGRFNTAVTLYDGSSNFGFAPTAGGFKINFMIIHPSAVAQVVKHRMPRIWTPQENQAADAYKFDLRLYHDAFVLDNKKSGIYVHCASTANT